MPEDTPVIDQATRETMVRAYHEVRETKMRKDVNSLRMAAFINSIDKIAISYMELGIFP